MGKRILKKIIRSVDVDTQLYPPRNADYAPISTAQAIIRQIVGAGFLIHPRTLRGLIRITADEPCNVHPDDVCVGLNFIDGQIAGRSMLCGNWETGLPAYNPDTCEFIPCY